MSVDTPFEERPTFIGLAGIEMTEATEDRVVGYLDITSDHHQPYGVVHGGVYSTLVETLASTGAAMWAIRNGQGGAMGLSNTTDFLKATASGRLIGVATPLHRGRSQQLWEVEIRLEGGERLIAHGQVRLQNVEQTVF